MAGQISQFTLFSAFLPAARDDSSGRGHSLMTEAMTHLPSGTSGALRWRLSERKVRVGLDGIPKKLIKRCWLCDSSVHRTDGGGVTSVTAA